MPPLAFFSADKLVNGQALPFPQLLLPPPSTQPFQPLLLLLLVRGAAIQGFEGRRDELQFDGVSPVAPLKKKGASVSGQAASAAAR